MFEYITGGGFNKQELPDSLAREGSLMLNALLENLSRLNSFEVIVMLDWRVSNPSGLTTAIITPEHDITEEFTRLVKQCDLVWPIAPEFDGILQSLCQAVESLGKILLTSPAAAVAIAGDKLKTYELLNRHHIAAVPTRLFENDYVPGEWMVKPVDGVGCADSYVLTTRNDFEHMINRQQGPYVIQPHLQGTKTSLSCLFKQGRAWLVCANVQHFDFIDRQYHLTDIVVNDHPDIGLYRQLIDKIARVLPELWGYVGIDLIENDQIWVLEINPRLTTSFTGIYEALGINIAGAVLQLVDGDPMLNPVYNKAIIVQAQQKTHAS
ncbi:MAG: ATP-grasp domain-containing protein [Methylobacter sp.]